MKKRRESADLLQKKAVKSNLRAWRRNRYLRNLRALRETLKRKPKKGNKYGVWHQFKILADKSLKLGNSLRYRKSKRDVLVDLPLNFSILENPEQTLNAIGSVIDATSAHVSRIKGRTIKRLVINHSQTKKHDLGAESLLAYVARRIKTVFSQSYPYPDIFGVYPHDNAMCRLIKGVGIVKELEIKSDGIDTDDNNTDGLLVFSAHGTDEDSSIYTIDRKTKATVGFKEHIDKCLGSHGFRLTDEGGAKLCSYTGEIIDNAEAHSGEILWKVVGYLDTVENRDVCEISIFNFGLPISETFTQEGVDKIALGEVMSYADAHKDRVGIKGKLDQSDLIMVAALQGHISSKKNIDDLTRGQGTVDLIQFFQTVCKERGTTESARMAIVSGHTYIVFDGTYEMKSDSDGRQVIAFNKENDLSFPPDTRFVTHMKNAYFPGTHISIRFMLPSSFQEESVGD